MRHAGWLLAFVAQLAGAQGEVAGRVVSADRGGAPLAGVEVTMPRLSLTVLSDSSGRFRLRNVPPGYHLLVMRAVGFRPESSMVTVDRDEIVSWDGQLTMADGTVLPERVVTAPEAAVPAKLFEFAERRKMGIGHFIDRLQLEKAEGGMRQTGDLIAQLPGVRVRRGSSKIWVATGRTPATGCAFCAMRVDELLPSDVAAGARPACFMDVYIDGALAFDSRQARHGLLDINSIRPEQIAGIEVYTSAAQIPAKYNRTANGCGVLLIWTR